MNKLSDKVAYIRGLVEGMGYTETSNDSKLILKIIDVLNETAAQIDQIKESIGELNDYIECVDDDLEALEFGDEDYNCDLDDEDDDDEDDEDDEEDEDDDEDEEDDEDEFSDDEPQLMDIDDESDEEFGMYEGCLCPECGGIFSILVNSDENQQYICPHCEKRVTAIKMNCKNVPVANAFSGDDE